MYTTEKTWELDLKVIFQVLQREFHIHANHACSTHIHTKPFEGWYPNTVRSLAKAAAVFDDSIMRIMPGSRKLAPWARSNFRGPTNPDVPIATLPEPDRKLIAHFSQISTRT